MNIQSPVRTMKAARQKTIMPWIACFILAAGLFAQAQSTNDSSSTTSADYSDFQVIVQRNIFNPSRFPSYRSGYRPPERGAPTFSLAGTMSYRKGMYAFFSGTSPEYQKALQQGGMIAGYTVTNIDFAGVHLQNAGKEVHMTVGSAMRQEGGGWVLSMPGQWNESPVTDTGSESSAATSPGTGATSTDTLPSGGAASDVLKRLMELRKQQEQQK
jgi:hypothetical protein